MERERMSLALAELEEDARIARSASANAEEAARAASERASLARRASERAFNGAQELRKRLAAEQAAPAPTPEPEDPGQLPRVLTFTHDTGGGPKMALTGPGRSRHLFHTLAFRHEAGGVTERIVVFANGFPDSKGSLVLPEFRLICDGREMKTVKGDLMIVPGGLKVFVDYEGGSMLDFAAALAEDGVTPGPQFDEKLLQEFERQRDRLPDVGPYVMGWPADPSGGGQGGDGIEPYWHLWRNCAGGRALALLELMRTAQREPRVMLTDLGELTWNTSTAYNPDGYHMPSEFVEFDETRLPGYASALHAFRPHDAQHFHRAYRAALWIDELTGGTHAFARWYLEMLANFQAACHLSTAADSKGVDDSGWWSLERIVAWAREQDGPNPKTGRGPVHMTRFAFECADRGIGGAQMRLVASLFESLYLVSANEHGRSYETEGGKIPAVSWATNWDRKDKCAQSRELQLAVAMMRDSGRPRLKVLAQKLAAHLGPFPPTLLNYTRDASAGKTNYGYELMTHGDTTSPEFGGPDASPEQRRLALLRVAESRTVEAGGVQPLNSCCSRSIWLDPDAIL